MPDHQRVAYDAPSKSETKSTREERYASQSWEALRESGNSVYDLVREYADVFPDKLPAELLADRGVRHEIDIVSGSKYCVTRQWPLPLDYVEAIDAFFDGPSKACRIEVQRQWCWPEKTSCC